MYMIKVNFYPLIYTTHANINIMFW